MVDGRERNSYVLMNIMSSESNHSESVLYIHVLNIIAQPSSGTTLMII